MDANKLNILLTDEAKAFILSLPEKAQKKVTFNIRKVEGGEMDKDLFKKLKASHIVQWNVLPTVGLLG